MDYNQRNQSFSNYTVLDSNPVSGERTVAKKFMANVFLWMFLALGISATMAYLFANNEALLNMLYVNTERGTSLTGLGMVVAFSPFAFVLIMSFGFNRISYPILTLLFLAYSAIFGMSMSVILLAYTAGSVIGCFASASVMFGVMALMGYTTEKDLTSFGRILSMGLIGMVVAMIINMFMRSNGMDMIISIFGVAIFTGLTAYDVQKLKRIGGGIEYDGTNANDTGKLAIMGALSLYLDFVNLFLFLLRLFGNRRD
jgi:uncharacterized protein